MEDYFKLGVTISLTDYATGKLSEINNRWKDIRKSMDAASDSAKLYDFGEKLTAFSSGITMTGSALAGIAIDFIHAGMQAGKLESNIRSLGVTAEEATKISSEVRIMSGEMGIAQETFLTGIYDIKSAVASLAPEELSAVAKNLGLAAVATKGDFAGLADLFGTTFSQFKKMYNESDTDFSKRFANTLSISVQQFKTDGAKMQIAMQALGASAASMGVTLEEQMAILGTLQNTMQPGVAGTAYRAFLSNVGKGFQELGLNAEDAQGKLKSMPDLLQELQSRYRNAFVIDSATGNSVLQLDARDELKKAFGTEEAVAAIEALLPKMNELKGSIETISNSNLDGTASALKEMSDLNKENLASQLERLSAGWNAFKTSLSSEISSGPLLGVVRWLGDVIQWLIEVSEKSPYLKTFFNYIVVGGGVVLTATGIFLGLVGVMSLYLAVTSSAAAKNIFHVLTVTWNTIALIARRTAVVALTIAEWALIGVVGFAVYGWTALTFVYNLMTGRTKLLTVWQGIQALATKGLTFASWLLNAALLANPIGLVIAGVLLAVGVVAMAVLYWDEFTAAVKSAWVENNFLLRVLSGLFGPLGTLFGVLDILQKKWESITEWIGKATNVVKDFFGIGGDKVEVGSAINLQSLGVTQKSEGESGIMNKFGSVFDKIGLSASEKVQETMGGVKMDIGANSTSSFSKALEAPSPGTFTGITQSPLNKLNSGSNGGGIQINIQKLVDKVVFQNNSTGRSQAGRFVGDQLTNELNRIVTQGNPTATNYDWVSGMIGR